MRASGPVGSICPSCGQPPQLAFAEQAFCGTDDCRIVTWNPTKTMDELLDDFGLVDLSGFDRTPSPHAFTCPRCGATSHHPQDLKEGYCGRCHAWTRGSAS